MIDSKLPAGCEEAARRPPKSGVAIATSTRRPRCTPNSTTFSRQLTCWSTTSYPSAEAPAGRRGSRTPSSSRWRSPKSSWDCRTTASFWRSPATGSRTCSPTCHVSRATTSVCARSPHRSSERSTTSPSARRGGAISCGCSIRPRSPARPRARRFGAPSSRGIAAYGYCRSHSRYFWGFRLYLLCASDGTPIAFELAPANAPEREVAREMLERVPLAGLTVIADKGFAGAEFEGWMADRGAEFLRPDRKDEPLQFGSLGRVRQWIESVFWTCKGQLGLERHGARTLPGLCARVGLRLLALAAGLRHNAEIGQPGRCFSAYGH